MKNISRKIAMILILIMLANSFTGCWTAFAIKGAGSGIFGEKIWVSILLDIATLGILLILFPSGLGINIPNETGIYLVSAEHNNLTDYISAMEIVNSLPEKERGTLMKNLNYLSETKHTDLVNALNDLLSSEITASIERLNNLSNTELMSAVQTFNSLSEKELNILTDKLNERAKSLQKIEYADVVALSHQKVSTVLCFEY
jgi:hypothetical protein